LFPSGIVVLENGHAPFRLENLWERRRVNSAAAITSPFLPCKPDALPITYFIIVS